LIPEFRLIDWIAIFVFTHIFAVGVYGLLFGGFLGGIIIYFGWELWRLYERWRIEQ